MNGDWKVPVLHMKHKPTCKNIMFLVTCGVLLCACDRVMPEPPQSFAPVDTYHLKDYFSQLNYDLDILDAGVPRLEVTSLPHDFSLIDDSQERRELFIMTMLPMILLANEEIAKDRKRVIELLNENDRRNPIAVDDMHWLQALAEHYRIRNFSPDDPKTREKLLRRVDTLPVSMALAQAANESGWGTSRFARQGNNLFGEWTFIKGAGIVPLRRDPGATHEVRLFPTLHESMRSYMHNLNTHRAYTELRVRRYELREAGIEPTGPELSVGLKKYSERGTAYVRDIRRMIEQNRFSLFREARLR